MRKINGTVELLTAATRGAVAVLRVTAERPDELVALVERSFRCRSSVDFRDASPGRILYGQWGHEDIVVCRLSPLTCEVHCHGGPAAVDAIQSDLVASGITVLEELPLSTDQLRDCFFSACDQSSIDVLKNLIEAEIQRVLRQTETLRTAGFVLSQAHRVANGEAQSGLAAWFERIANAIHRRKADPPSTSDFNPFESLKETLRWQSFARHLIVPYRVLVLGRPNAGKSSLVNAIVGYDRTIVSEQPGTTRDLIDVRTVLDGWPFEFVDSAGLREHTVDEIERTGIRNAIAGTATCDAILLLHDASTGEPLEPSLTALVQSEDAPVPTALLLTKNDLPSSPPAFETFGFKDVLSVSAVTGDGIARVQRWLLQTLIESEPGPEQLLPLPGAICNFLNELNRSESHHGI